MENPWHYIVQNFDESYRCIICGYEDMDDDYVTQHVKDEEHEEALEQYARDITLKGNKHYYCGLCQCSISGYENVYQHLTGDRHDDLLNASSESEEESSEDEEEDEEINFIIDEGQNFYYCIICGLDIDGYNSSYWHEKNSEHLESLEKFGNDISYLGRNNYHCNLCNCRVCGYKNVFRHLVGQKHENNMDQSSSDESEESEESSVDYSINPWTFIVTLDDESYDCFICNKNMASNAFANDHVNGNEHWNKIWNYGQDIYDLGSDKYACDLCDCTITSFKNVYSHLMGQKHQGNMDD